jgi:hypothetical protein
MEKNGISKHVLNLIPVVLLGIAGFLYPSWIANGYLEDVYSKIGAFIAIYGGFIGALLWYIKNKKNF